MSPWGAATVATAAGGESWVLVELIAPNYVAKGAAIDFIKGRTHRVLCCIASASASCLKTFGITAGHSKLLTEGCPGRLHLPTEQTCSGSTCSALWEGRRIELEYKPPIDRMPFGNKGPRSFSSAHRSRYRSTSGNLYIPSPYKPRLPIRHLHMVVPVSRSRVKQGQLSPGRECFNRIVACRSVRSQIYVACHHGRLCSSNCAEQRQNQRTKQSLHGHSPKKGWSRVDEDASVSSNANQRERKYRLTFIPSGGVTQNDLIHSHPPKRRSD